MANRRRPPEPPVAETETPKVEAEPVKEVSTGYAVAEGKSLCLGNGMGIIGPGAEVKPEYFGDQETMEKLIKNGSVVST